jgi:hypothetical protein
MQMHQTRSYYTTVPAQNGIWDTLVEARGGDRWTVPPGDAIIKAIRGGGGHV